MKMTDKKPHDYTMREQLEGLMNDNIEKYPDAIEWIHSVMVNTRLDTLRTKKERFIDTLMGKNCKFDGHPYNPSNPNKVVLIKWYREKYGVGLKEAKEACDAFILETCGLPF